jgi:hypothetical protein
MIRHLLKTESLAWPLLVCLAVVWWSVFSVDIADPDLWGHVQYGKDTIARGSLFDTDPYSYLSDGFPWINHELLCELTLGWIEPRFGAVGMQAWKCLMGLAMVGCIIWSHRRSRAKPLTIVVLTALAAMSLRLGWVARPQVFTYTFLSVLALLMTEHARFGWHRALWFAPPLVVAWTNAHGGFVAGLCLLAVHVAFAAWDEWRRRSAGWLARSLEMLMIVAASVAATLVNPYNVELLTWVWDSLTWPRPEISEWVSVPLGTFEYMSFKVLVAVTIVALAATRLPRNTAQATMLALAAWESFGHVRHIPLFAILVLYWLPPHLDDVLDRLLGWLGARARLQQVDARPQSLYGWMLGLATAVLAVVSVWQMHWLRVDKAVYPVTAFQFIHDHELSGRMVTEFNWGQYCLYAFWPAILVSTDGRFDTCYSRETLDLNFDFIIGDLPRWRNRSPRSGPFCCDRVLDVGAPNLALVSRDREGAVQAIAARADWVLLYQDALAQVWGRRTIYDDPASRDYLPPAARRISDAPQFGCVSYPALPARRAPSVLLADGRGEVQ